jgi:hypothetical protein
MEDIHDIKGFVPLPHNWWWLCLLVILAAILAAAYWLWKRRQPTSATNTLPPPTPYELAIRALQRLREENPPVEEFYTRLSDIVRHYLEGRFYLRAPERTTEEFLYEVSTNNTLAQGHKDLLGAFLQESDLVKFARHHPEQSDMQRALEAAEKFVRDTQPQAQEAVASA